MCILCIPLLLLHHHGGTFHNRSAETAPAIDEITRQIQLSTRLNSGTKFPASNFGGSQSHDSVNADASPKDGWHSVSCGLIIGSIKHGDPDLPAVGDELKVRKPLALAIILGPTPQLHNPSPICELLAVDCSLQKAPMRVVQTIRPRHESSCLFSASIGVSSVVLDRRQDHLRCEITST